VGLAPCTKKLLQKKKNGRLIFFFPFSHHLYKQWVHQIEEVLHINKWI